MMLHLICVLMWQEGMVLCTPGTCALGVALTDRLMKAASIAPPSPAPTLAASLQLAQTVESSMYTTDSMIGRKLGS